MILIPGCYSCGCSRCDLDGKFIRDPTPDSCGALCNVVVTIDDVAGDFLDEITIPECCERFSDEYLLVQNSELEFAFQCEWDHTSNTCDSGEHPLWRFARQIVADFVEVGGAPVWRVRVRLLLTFVGTTITRLAQEVTYHSPPLDYVEAENLYESRDGGTPFVLIKQSDVVPDDIFAFPYDPADFHWCEFPDEILLETDYP